MSPHASKTDVVLTGLTSQEAETRLEQFGPNEPAVTKHHSFLSDLLHVFMNPLVLILVIAAAASAFLDDRVDAGIIGVIVLLSAAIDLSQTYRSQRAVEKLRAQVALRQPYCAMGSGKNFGGVTWCRKTLSGFQLETWFPQTPASWMREISSFCKQP